MSDPAFEEVHRVLHVLRGAAGLSRVVLLYPLPSGEWVVAAVEPPGGDPVEGAKCRELGAASPAASGSGPILLNPDAPMQVRVPWGRPRVLGGAAAVPVGGGVLMWAEHDTTPLAKDHLDAMVEAARLVEGIAARRRLDEAMTARVHVLEAVVEGVRRILESRGEADCAKALAEGAARMTGATAAVTTLLRPDGDCEVAAACGEASGLAGRVHDPGPGLVGLALRSWTTVPTNLRFQPATMKSVLGHGADLALAAGDPVLVHPFGAASEPLGALVLARGAFEPDGTIHAVRTLCDAAALLIGEFRLRERVERDAMQDGLTGLYNRPAFMRHLGESVSFSRRHGGLLALLMIDADHFKGVNDAHGHLAGDTVLRFIADTVRKALREYDFAGRYGGEEFAVALPLTELEGARIVAERIRVFCGGSPVPVHGTALTVTVSIGAAVLGPAMSRTEDLIRAADEALYEAKRGGRNRVVAK